MKSNVKLFKIITAVTLFLTLLTITEAITAGGNTTVDGSTRTAIIYDVTETTPYIITNTTTTFHYFILYQDGNPLTGATTNLTIQTQTFNLTYSPSTMTYWTQLHFNTTEIGDYDFTVKASKPYNTIHDLEGTYHVRNFTKTCFSLWTTKNMTERYDNQLAHIFIIPHNKSRATTRIPELFYPLEFIMDTTFAKANKYLYLPEKKAITSLEAGFHKPYKTSEETCLALPTHDVYTAYIIEGKNMNFLNTFYSRYTYESMNVNTFLMTGEANEELHNNIYISGYDTHPVILIVTYILWVIAITLIIIIPIYIGITSGEPKTAVIIFGGLTLIIPAITYIINTILKWIFT